MEHAPVVIADDFTGAAECAMQWCLAGLPATVHLGPDLGQGDLEDHGPDGAAGAVQVIDTHSRRFDEEQAAVAVAGVLAALPHRPDFLFKKIDSLWRGNIGAELRALRTAGYRLIVAGALPDLGRSVVHGVPLVEGKPLREAGLWSVETRTEPEAVADLLAPLSTDHLDLHEVRAPYGPEGWLATELRAVDAVVVDAETDADLYAVARASLALSRRAATDPVALVGTEAMARALAECEQRHVAYSVSHSPDAPGTPGGPVVSGPSRPVLAVVGSANATAAEQVASLHGAGTPVFAPDQAEAAGAELAAGGAAALAVTDTERRDPAVVLRELDDAVRRALAAAPHADLVLTGGETARTLLDALGVHTLEPLRQLQHGVVVSLADDGRLVAAKPGSSGTADVLTQAIDLLRALRAAPTHQENA